MKKYIIAAVVLFGAFYGAIYYIYKEKSTYNLVIKQYNEQIKHYQEQIKQKDKALENMEEQIKIMEQRVNTLRNKRKRITKPITNEETIERLRRLGYEATFKK